MVLIRPICLTHLIPLHLLILIILLKCTNYEHPHYAASSSLLSISPPSRYSPQYPALKHSRFSSLNFREELHPLQNHRQDYSLVYSNLRVFRQQTRRQKVLDRMASSNTEIQFLIQFLLNRILIYYYRTQLYEL
jgi:hypothetical protein